MSDLSRPLSPRRWARIVATAARAVRQPDITHFYDFETAMMDLASPAQLERMAQRFRQSPELAATFDEKYAPPPLTLAQARACPPGSLGRAYADFMERYQLSADYLPPRTLAGDLTWFRERQAQAHDQWHAVLGIGADIAGEVEIVAVLLAQFRSALPREPLASSFTFLLIFIYLLHIGWYRPRELFTCVRRFVVGYRRGAGLKPLFGVHFEALWALPVEQVRASLAR